MAAAPDQAGCEAGEDFGGKYLAMISAFGGLVMSDTTTTNAAQISVIGITGRKP
jgi:hypothetical protein